MKTLMRVAYVLFFMEKTTTTTLTAPKCIVLMTINIEMHNFTFTICP